MKRLARLLCVFGLSIAGPLTGGCDEEIKAQLTDAVLVGAATFVQQTTVELLNGLLAQSTGP